MSIASAAPAPQAAPTASKPTATPQAAPAATNPPSSGVTPSPAAKAPDAASGAATPPPATEAKPQEGEAAKTPAEGEEITPERRAELSRAAKAARRAAAQNRELLARNQRLEQVAQQATRSEATTQQEVARLRNLAQTDKAAFAREMGLTSKELMEAVAKDGSAEAVLQRELAKRDAELAELKAWKEQQETSRRQQEMAQLREQATSAFKQESSDAAAYPNVAKMPFPARMAWAQQLLAEDRARAGQVLSPEELRNYAPTNKQLLAHMEKLAAEGVPAAPGAQAPSGSSPVDQQNGTTSPQTVSNAVASQKYTLPPDFDTLPRHKKNWYLARQLEAMGGGTKNKRRAR